MTEKTYTRILHFLTLIVFFKVLGYFTLSENVAITRVLKIIIRFSMTGFLLLIYQHLQKTDKQTHFELEKPAGLFWYCAYLFLGLCSLLWSTNKGYSALQLAMNTESLVFAYLFIKTYLLFEKQAKAQDFEVRISHIFCYGITPILLIFIIGFLINPDKFLRLTHGGAEKRLGGYLMNPNELGMLAVVGLGSLLSELKFASKKLGLLICFAILMYGLVLTESRSSMIGLLLIILYFIHKSENVKIKIGVLACIVLAIPVVINTIFIKQGDLEEVLSMTGRLPFWKALLTEGLPKEPIFGFGYMRIAYTEHFQSAHTYAGKMTHNTFIQVLMNLGFVGFTIILFQMFYTLRAFAQNADVAKGLFFVGMFIPIIINSFTEFGIFGEANFGILFYQFLLCLFCLELQQKKGFKTHKKAAH